MLGAIRRLTAGGTAAARANVVAARNAGPLQQYFVDHEVRNLYSVSISGYRIPEAGASPISQLAFTLANGYVVVASADVILITSRLH